MVKTFINYPSYSLPQELMQILKKYSYIFNPSLILHNGVGYLSIRVYEDKSETILGLIFVWDDAGNIEQLNLSRYFEDNEGIHKVADPKLFIMNNKVYGTFNTGDAIKDFNHLVLFQLEKSRIFDYKFCGYNERYRTEKNWAFFIDEEELYALYNLSPLTILKAIKTDENYIEFEKCFYDKTQSLKNYSIGTQLVKVKGKFCFIAHKKLYRKRKRLYLGRICILFLKDSPKIAVKKSFLIHSWKSLFGSKFKFNKNLISCSYFSGLSLDRENIIVGYGINDVDWNIVTLKQKELWL
ncbi:hypothetical protein [Aestuariivivens marinum]|uniref:hypothetical protein n=1 Tax=Aestuariivivens marinum TaxID=2913555 RepID=UPI001F56B627|nr:hypothetical protein [Aestuariivivens marinum]